MTVRTRRLALTAITLILAIINRTYYAEIVHVIGPLLERMLVMGLGLVCFSAIIPEILGFED